MAQAGTRAGMVKAGKSGGNSRRYRCPVAHPALFEDRPVPLTAEVLAELEYDPTSGEQRGSQLQGVHTGMVHELAAAAYLRTLIGSASAVRSVLPEFDGDDLVLSVAATQTTGASAADRLLPERTGVLAPALPTSVGPAVPTVVPGERVNLQPARRLLLAAVRSLAFCHERSLTTREARPTALFSYGKGTQPWDSELDELFECRKGRSPFSDGNAFDDVWIDYVPPEILLGAEVAATPRGGATRPEPEDFDVAAADMWATGCWFAEMLRGEPLFVGEFAARIEVLIKVMSVVGCPTADSWPGVDRRPGYTLHYPAWQSNSEMQSSNGADSPRARSFPRAPDSLLSRMAQENGHSGLLAMDMLQGLLTLDPKQRMTAAEALQHPLLAELVVAQQTNHAPSNATVLGSPAACVVRGNTQASDTAAAREMSATAARGHATVVRASSQMMSSAPESPRTRPRQRKPLPRASKRPCSHRADALEASWGDGLPDAVWGLIGQALINSDSADLDRLASSGGNWPQCQATWMYSDAQQPEGGHSFPTTEDDWKECTVAVSTKLEESWRKWRCAGCLPSLPRCDIYWPADRRKPTKHPVDFATMTVGRNRRMVPIRRVVTKSEEHAPLPTSDECAARRLSVLSARAVCSTWCSALTSQLLSPASPLGAALQPRTPRVADCAVLRGGIMADSVALCCLRTLSARRSPVAQLPTKAGAGRITASMRGILMDWLFEVAEAYHISRRSLHGCARILDVALYAADAEAAPVPREELQLLGVCSLLLSAKHHESSYPSIGKLCYITDNAYTPQDVRARERLTIESLNFQVGLTATPVTVLTALQLVLPPFNTRAGWADDPSLERLRLQGLANYLCDLTLMDQRFTADRPLEVAQACVVLAAASLDSACPPMISLPGLFVEESDAGASVTSDTPGVRGNPTVSPSGSEAGQENSEGASGCSVGIMRRARLMKTLHNLHRLAWTRRQTDCTKLLKASPELAAADLTSRTDAVTVHYSRTRWKHVASTVPPLSYKELSKRLAITGMSSPPNSPVFSLPEELSSA